MASTPLHYDLYHAFGWTPPQFAHVGLLVDEKKAKLSKRNLELALDVRSMKKENGVLPESLLNFLALLGWSNPTDNDVMDTQQLIQNFDLKFTKGNTMVRMEKLWYLQKHHVARRCDLARSTQSSEPVDPLVDEIVVEVKKLYPKAVDRFKTKEELRKYCEDVLLADSKAYQNAEKYATRNRYFFTFDAAQVPTRSEGSREEPDSISIAAVEGMVRQMLEAFDFRQPYHEAAIAGKVPNGNATVPNENNQCWFDRDNARIHAAISHHIWRMVLTNPDSDMVPFTDQAFDDAAFVTSVASSPSTTSGQDAAHTINENDDSDLAGQAVLKRKKALNTAVMKYLRERLSYGLPGPSIGVVMAILGYEECCKRLGVKTRVGGGW